MEQLQLTKLVRTIMRRNGYSSDSMWTNKNPRSRTVKVYSHGWQDDLKLIQDLHAFLTPLKVKYQVYTTPGSNHPYGMNVGAVIVRFPYV